MASLRNKKFKIKALTFSNRSTCRLDRYRYHTRRYAKLDYFLTH